MKVFVTGGAGYIGSVAVDSLIAAGHDVMVFDNLYMGHRAAVNETAAFVQGDLADPETVEQAVREFQPQAIMHFASYSLVGESMTHPAKYLGDNVRNALNLIEAAVKFDVERFIFSSTANLFGSPRRIPISAEETLDPGSAYGESKLYIERMLRWYHDIHGLRFAALRYFNAAGCTEERGEDHDPETHLIPLVIQVALGQREQIKIFGEDYETPDGTCVRDYVHVSDLAEAHLLALEALETRKVLRYNLGNGNGFSVREVIETVREVSGHPVPAVSAERRPGDPPTLVADSTCIIEELGWQPKFPTIGAIIESAWNWHRRHPGGYPKS